MDNMAIFKKQERLVLATLYEKSTKGRTKHCPLQRAGLHAPFDSVLHVLCPGREQEQHPPMFSGGSVEL